MPTCGLCCSRVPETTRGTLLPLELAILTSLLAPPPDPVSPTGLSSLHAVVEAAGGPGFGDGFA